MTMFRAAAAMLAAATLASFVPRVVPGDAEASIVSQPQVVAPVVTPEAEEAAARLAILALAQQGVRRHCEARARRNDGYDDASPEEQKRLMDWCLSSITISY